MPKPDKLRRSARRALRRGETIDAARLMRLASAIENPQAPPRPGQAPDEYDDADTRTPEELNSAVEDMNRRLAERFRKFRRDIVDSPKILAYRLDGLRDWFKRNGWTVTIDRQFKPEDADNPELMAWRLEGLRQDFEYLGYTIPPE